MNSKQKGKRGELSLCRFLREQGYEARRTAQYCGNTGDAADVVGLPGLHVECKYVERINLRDALEQAKRDARPGNIPVVFHRSNNRPWVVCLGAEDFIEIYREWEAGMDERKNARDLHQ